MTRDRRDIVDEVGTVVKSETGHTSFGAWVFSPIKNYASDYSLSSIGELPTNKEDQMDHYKSESFVKKAVNEENISIVEARMSIEESEKKLQCMGIKLYRQFRAFVMRNKNLYDKDFVDTLLVHKYSITQVVMINSKSAVRLRLEQNKLSPMFVMIPLLFLSDPIAYKNARTRKRNFGKDATDDHINKHYDGEIDKLNQEIARLKTERASMSISDDEWV